MRKNKTPLTWEQIVQSCENSTVIQGIIVMADPHEQYFKVQIGYRKDETPIFGFLPFSEFSIQNLILTHTSTNDTGIITLGKDAIFAIGRTIDVCIDGILTNGIYLSRKKIQLNPFNNFKIHDEVICTITSIHHPYVFVDIGNGIVALNRVHDLSSCRYNNVANWFKIGDKFPAIITEIGDDKRITVSRKAYFQKHSSDYDDIKEDQAILCRVASPIDNGRNGWFVEMTPLAFGIMDTKEEMDFHEGDEVICFIQKITPRLDGKIAYHLKFISIV